MVVIGVDPSLNSTGWAVIKKEGGRLVYLSSGIIKNGSRDLFHAKLVNIADVIEGVLAEFKPARAGIEETYVNLNAQTSLKLGAVRGCLLLTLARTCLDVRELSPTFIKKAIVGAGRAEKSQVAFMVGRLVSGIPAGRNFASEDETDALAIAIAAAL